MAGELPLEERPHEGMCIQVDCTCTVQPKNNARARTSFCVRKKKFFLRLTAGRVSLSPGNRKNFFSGA